jgi:ankyrin repeat protein
VRILLEHGANANFKITHQRCEEWTALFFAAKGPRRDNKTIIQALIMHGADVNSRNAAQQTPLLLAVSDGAINQVKSLLQNRADIMAKDANGESVLHLALLRNWCLGMLRCLVESGADVNSVGGKQGETPIFYAIRSCQEEAVCFLLSVGANVHFRNIEGLTPLFVAIRTGSVESTEQLLKYGALANSIDPLGKCPLHHVAESYFRSSTVGRRIVEVLIQHGANVNCRDFAGYTPLHRILAQKWTWEIAADLLKAGAHRRAISNDGSYPHDMVPSGPWAETLRLFIQSYKP